MTLAVRKKSEADTSSKKSIPFTDYVDGLYSVRTIEQQIC